MANHPLTHHKLLNSLLLRVLACYIRRFPFDNGKWRLIPAALHACRDAHHIDTWREIRTRYGFRIQVDLGDWLGRHLYVTGEYESATTHVIAELLNPGGVFLDVGANLGYFSLLAATRVGPSGRVYSVEALPLLHDRLLGNFQRNGFTQCHLLPFAVSDAEGELDFHPGPQDHRGISSLRARGDTSEPVRVPVKRLDDELSDAPKIDFVKIDVEGAESHALDGMACMLERDQPPIVLEVTESYLNDMGRSVSDIERLLSPMGYRFFRIDNEVLTPLHRLADDGVDQFNALCTVSPLPEILAQKVVR